LYFRRNAKNFCWNLPVIKIMNWSIYTLRFNIVYDGHELIPIVDSIFLAQLLMAKFETWHLYTCIFHIWSYTRVIIVYDKSYWDKIGQITSALNDWQYLLICSSQVNGLLYSIVVSSYVPWNYKVPSWSNDLDKETGCRSFKIMPISPRQLMLRITLS
jgi:hypothetical protein